MGKIPSLRDHCKKSVKFCFFIMTPTSVHHLHDLVGLPQMDYFLSVMDTVT